MRGLRNDLRIAAVLTRRGEGAKNTEDFAFLPSHPPS